MAAVRNLPGLPETAFEGLDRSLLHAVYTPFSVILFYEVLQLVFILTTSHTSEIAKQYQIISLIVVRRVFKDIGSFENIEHWLAEPNAVRAVLLDMGGAVLMFLMVTAFSYLRRVTPKVPIDRDLGGFIELKKAVAVLLLVVLVGLAAVNLGSWLGLVPAWLEIPGSIAGEAASPAKPDLATRSPGRCPGSGDRTRRGCFANELKTAKIPRGGDSSRKPVALVLSL